LQDQGFAALPFFRFAITAIATIPATRIALPVIANGKTETGGAGLLGESA